MSDLAQIKLDTITIERNMLKSDKRTINIDPGYITLTQVVVASTKPLAHRIYLTKDIYADLQLVLGKNNVITFRHTFADYKEHKAYFLEQRK